MSSEIILLARRSRPRRHVMVGGVAIVAFLAASLLAGVLPAAATTTGRVAVDVFEDTDRDGARTASEPGWSGRYVQFYDAAWRAVASVPTDAEGRVSVDLPAGDYHVMYSPSQWDEISSEWVPSADGVYEPVYGLSVLGGTTTNLAMGFRRVVWSASLDDPVSVATAADGLIVESFNDIVSAETVIGVLDHGVRGGEAETTTIRFGFRDYETSFCSAWAAGGPGSYGDFVATCHVSYQSWATSGDRALFHEYGHVWANYRDTIVQQDGTLERYLEVRGLTGDPRLGSSHAWDVRELIAEDYRQLLGSPTAAAWPQENADLPAATDVPGLDSFLVDEFSVAPTVPDSTNTSENDTTAPTVTVTSPSEGATVDGTTSVSVLADDSCGEGGVCTSRSSLSVVMKVDGGVAAELVWDTQTHRHIGTIDPAAWGSGTHTIVAVATDESGNSATSDPVAIDVPDTQATKGKGGSKKDGGGPGGGKGGGRGNP